MIVIVIILIWLLLIVLGLMFFSATKPRDKGGNDD